MYTNIDRQLAQIRHQEILQEAAEARANRQRQMAQPQFVTRKMVFTLAAAASVVGLILVIIAG